MKRRLATALTAAALVALSLTPGLEAGAQTDEGPGHTGEKTKKVVRPSCLVHPEFNVRSAGRCPKCRAEERKVKGAREKDRRKGTHQPQPHEGDDENE